MIAKGFQRLITGDPDGQPEWLRQLERAQDDGYFGPGSAAWEVHGSLATLVGGIRALLMQALHPGALAGVQQYSRYEDDALGRLAGTARWLTVVTFGDIEQADRECARVRGMHRKVPGTADPELLRWVHVAFTDSFLAAHRVWGGPLPGGSVPGEDGEDAYVREWARAGELVGVIDPPRSVVELGDQLRSYDGVLRGDAATARMVHFLRNPPLPLAARPAYGVLFAGAAATVPRPYRTMLRLPPTPLAVVRPAVGALLSGMGLVLGTSPRQRRDGGRVPAAATPQP